MALVLADRVRDTTTTTGTGTVTLSGTAPTGYQTFGAAIGNTNTTYYTINAGSQWEVGIGTYSSTGPTLARTTVLASSNSGSLVDFSTGTKDVFVTYPAEKSVNYDASNNVGIGTTSPSFKLDVQGNSSSTAIVSRVYNGDTSASSLAAFNCSTGQGVSAEWYSYSSANWFGTKSNHPQLFITNNSERMRIDTSGNLGIGTTSPTAGAGYTSISIRNATNGGNIDLGVGSTIYGQWLATSAASRLLAANGAYQTFEVGGTERMRIDTSGNVGIGTTSPGVTLEVAGNSIRLTRSAGLPPAFLGQQSSGTLSSPTATTSGSQIMAIGSSGYNGSAYTSTPSAAIRLLALENYTATANGAGITFETTAIGSASSARAEVMRIDGSGNVGIGTSAPGFKLDVSGDAHTSGSVFTGSDANGWGRIINSGGALYFQAGSLNSGSATAQPFIFTNMYGGSERMRIDASGNGIGATAPQGKLDVQSRSSGVVTAGLILDNRVANSVNTGIDLRFYVNDGGDARYAAVRSVQSTSGNYADMRFLVSNSASPAEAMRITPVGNVGIGQSSPGTKLWVGSSGNGSGTATPDAISIGDTFANSAGDAAKAKLRLFQNAGGFIYGFGVSASLLETHVPSGAAMAWYVNNGETFRVTSGGDMGVGISTPASRLDVRKAAGATAVVSSYNQSTTGNVYGYYSDLQLTGNSTSSYHYAGVTQGVNIWYLYGNGTSSWSSDQRLKKNIEATRDGYLDDLCKLRVVKYNWRADDEDKPRELGLIAQEVEEVFPGLVEEALHTLDETEIKYKVLKGSVLPYMLLKALQEAATKIDELSARVAQLEGK